MSLNFQITNTSALNKCLGQKQKRSAHFLSWQLIVSIMGLPLSGAIANAQTTTCSGASSSSCVDLYQGTLAAMQAFGYQPSGLSSASGATTSGNPIVAPWAITSFQGGVISASPMVFNVPTDTGMPSNQNLTSTFVYVCPGSNATSGTVSVQATISDTTEISSTQSVTNSSSSFNNGSTTVTVGYAPPNTTGGASVSASGTYAWGTTTSEGTTTGSGTSNTAGTASTYTYEIGYNLNPGYGQTITVNDSVTQYSNVNWTSQISVTGTLSNTLFGQRFVNTVKPFATTSNLNGSGKAANIWYPPTTWVGTNNDVLASPSGTYAFFPDSNAYLYGLQWSAANNATVMFKQGSDSSQSGFALYLGTNSPDNNKYGNFWGGTGVGSPSTQAVQWHPTVSPAYLALVDDGDLIAYNSAGESVWSSGTNKGVVSPPQVAYQATLQQLLPPPSSPFVASGSYASTTYGTTGTIGSTTPTALTSDQLNQYCPTSTSASQVNPAETMSYDDGEEFLQAEYNPNRRSGLFMKAQLRDDDQERRRLEGLRRNESGERRLDPEGRGFQPHNSVDGDQAGALEKRRELGKVVKIRGPLELKPSQYYAADLPGFKVTKVTVRSDSLTNYVGFAPGSSNVAKEDLAKSKSIRFKIGKIKKTSVKPKQMM